MIRPSLHRIEDLDAAFAGAGLGDPAHHALRQHCQEFLDRYAHLEDELLGGVSFVVPEHLLREHPLEGPLEAIEGLARRERKRLAWGSTGERNLVALLDREGLKVYRPPFPDRSPLSGIFLFDDRVGPAFLLDGRLSPGATNSVAARLYGHYLLDHDPYEIRLVSREGVAADPRDLRALHFATALLVDADELGTYLCALSPGGPITAETLRHLETYFEADPRTLLARLVFLDLIPAEAISALAGALEEGEPLGEADPFALLPERYVRLALEAHGRGTLALPALAAHLETDEATAARLAAHFHIEDVESAAPPPPPERKPDGGDA